MGAFLRRHERCEQACCAAWDDEESRVLRLRTFILWYNMRQAEVETEFD